MNNLGPKYHFWIKAILNRSITSTQSNTSVFELKSSDLIHSGEMKWGQGSSRSTSLKKISRLGMFEIFEVIKYDSLQTWNGFCLDSKFRIILILAFSSSCASILWNKTFFIHIRDFRLIFGKDAKYPWIANNYFVFKASELTRIRY